MTSLFKWLWAGWLTFFVLECSYIVQHPNPGQAESIAIGLVVIFGAAFVILAIAQRIALGYWSPRAVFRQRAPLAAPAQALPVVKETAPVESPSMPHTLRQRIFIALWIVVGLLGLLGLVLAANERDPSSVLILTTAVVLILGVPLALIQFVVLGSAMPAALRRK